MCNEADCKLNMWVPTLSEQIQFLYIYHCGVDARFCYLLANLLTASFPLYTLQFVLLYVPFFWQMTPSLLFSSFKPLRRSIGKVNSFPLDSCNTVKKSENEFEGAVTFRDHVYIWKLMQYQIQN